MADHVGQQLGNYRLIRLLGTGGYAEVYQGEHIYLKSLAAIKVLHAQLAPEAMESFLAEARNLSHLVHPHIVRVLDFGVEGNTPFLVMDYAPNGSLREYHPVGTQLPLAVVVDYIKQLVDALQYAHNEKIIHRDIKPENMLLARRNEILLSDFGIAIIAQSTHVQGTQNIAGTISYMAPEQIQAHPRQASDQYALGIVVYEWLSGDRPFHGSFSEIAAKQMFVPPPPLREKIPMLPPEVEQVVMTTLEKDPNKRFANVQAFARALELASQPSSLGEVVLTSNLSSQRTNEVEVTPLEQSRQEPAVAMTPPTHTPSPLSEKEFTTSSKIQASKMRISRRTVLVALAGLTTAGASVAAWIFSHLSSHQQGDTIYIYHGHFNLVVDVAWSPDGQRIASGSADGTAQVWDATTGNHVLTYRGHSAEVRVVPWSPNGKRIASGSDDHTVQVWDASTGHPFFTYHGHSDKVLDVAWSPNGGRIASGGRDQTVQVWDASTGHPFFTYHGHSAVVDTVAWSPNGQLIASGSVDKTVQVWDASTGHPFFTYHGHLAEGRDVAWSPDGKRIASGSFDHTVQVWDATTGGNALIYHGHSGNVYAVAWSPDGKRIASASFDQTVQVWDASTGVHMYTYNGHADAVEAVAWSPDGQYIASGGGDTTVRVWIAG